MLEDAIARAIPGNEAAKTAIELAVLDLVGRRAGRSVADLLGGAVRDAMPTLDILPMEPPDRMAELAVGLRERLGTSRFKVKIDADVAAGVARVAAIRAALPDAMLVVDANGAWDVAAARVAVEALAPHDVAVVEQPVPGHRLDDLAEVRRTSPIPIGADESVRPEFVDRLIAMHAADVINLKVTREGGIRPALAVAAAARAAGMAIVVGSVVQTGLVDAACAQLFAVLPDIAYNESGKAPAWHPRDVVIGLEVGDGLFRRPVGPGLGVTVDEDALAAFRPTD
jgi:muconate cycloisomerase